MKKTFKTNEQLIEFLKFEKNLVILDEERARQILKKIGYFSLISGYKEIFKIKFTRKYDGIT